MLVGQRNSGKFPQVPVKIPGPTTLAVSFKISASSTTCDWADAGAIGKNSLPCVIQEVRLSDQSDPFWPLHL